jgi:hypothetical protein
VCIVCALFGVVSLSLCVWKRYRRHVKRESLVFGIERRAVQHVGNTDLGFQMEWKCSKWLVVRKVGTLLATSSGEHVKRAFIVAVL